MAVWDESRVAQQPIRARADAKQSTAPALHCFARRAHFRSLSIISLPLPTRFSTTASTFPLVETISRAVQSNNAQAHSKLIAQEAFAVSTPSEAEIDATLVSVSLILPVAPQSQAKRVSAIPGSPWSASHQRDRIHLQSQVFPCNSSTCRPTRWN